MKAFYTPKLFSTKRVKVGLPYSFQTAKHISIISLPAGETDVKRTAFKKIAKSSLKNQFFYYCLLCVDFEKALQFICIV